MWFVHCAIDKLLTSLIRLFENFSKFVNIYCHHHIFHVSAEEIERRETERRQTDQRKHEEEIQVLKRTNQQLRVCKT